MEALQISMPEKLEDQKKRCADLIGKIEEIGDTIRNISSSLRPAMLDDLGFIPTMYCYIEDFGNRTPGLKIYMKTTGVKKRLDREIEIVLDPYEHGIC